MNIGSMLRAWMGDASPANRKVLELRIGQIVRGVLVEMLDNREALMNINGVSVRAKLEAELPAGQGALLQVQPGSSSNTIVLKPLAGAVDLAPDEALRNVLKQFGLPDQKWSYELLRGLRRDGYALDGDTSASFREAAALKPASVETASWMSTADVAFRRGLPVSEATLAALRQALYGPPLHEELASFAQLLRQSSPSAASPSAPWAASLQQLLQQGDQLLALGRANLGGEPAPLAAAPQATAGSGGQAVQADIGQSAVHRQDAQAAMRADAMPAQVSSRAASPLPATSSGGSGQAATAANASPHPGAGAIAAGTNSSPANPSASPALSAAAQAAQQVTVREVPPVAQSSFAVQPEAAPASAAPSGNIATSWLGRFLQWLGVGHENQLLQTMTDGRPLPEQAVPSAATSGALPEAQRQAAETLKSALLSLIAHEETPPALREAAQSLVHHITGQQLLLSSERQFNQPYSYMTLFIPMKGQDGDTTATVHVQTRRSRKGEWDADNCRLLFDLRMRYLGNTVVDVQVVDRIVSVKLMNDFPDMTDMADHAREELADGLREIGFQLLALHVEPLPVTSASEQGEPGDPLPSWQPSDYSAKPYKGVDYRI